MEQRLTSVTIYHSDTSSVEGHQQACGVNAETPGGSPTSGTDYRRGCMYEQWLCLRGSHLLLTVSVTHVRAELPAICLAGKSL